MTEHAMPRSWGNLSLFFLLCYAVFGFGGLFQPGDWYESLNRAPWSPPNIAFPVVWVILYALIAIAGWQIFAHGSRILKWAWSLQLAFNGVWSWLFFGKQWVLAGLIDLVIIDLLVILLIFQARRQSLNLIGWLLCPYLLWLLLATSLNTYILLYN